MNCMCSLHSNRVSFLDKLWLWPVHPGWVEPVWVQCRWQPVAHFVSIPKRLSTRTNVSILDLRSMCSQADNMYELDWAEHLHRQMWSHMYPTDMDLSGKSSSIWRIPFEFPDTVSRIHSPDRPDQDRLQFSPDDLAILSAVQRIQSCK